MNDRCKVCNQPIYETALTDSVGRQTSTLVWRHWDTAANADHQAESRWQRVP